MMISRIASCTPLRTAFRGSYPSSPYPVNGGNVEKLKYETENGMRGASGHDALDEYYEEERMKRNDEEWGAFWSSPSPFSGECDDDEW